MRGVNKAIIIGSLGADPEIKYMPSGGAVCNLSIATNESWVDKSSGEKQERTEWHRVVVFGRLAEIAGEYLRKGSPIFIEGRIQTRKWKSQSGEDRYSTEIVANDMQMLGKRSETGTSEYAATAPQPQPQPQAPVSAQSEPKPTQDFDDDIPF